MFGVSEGTDGTPMKAILDLSFEDGEERGLVVALSLKADWDAEAVLRRIARIDSPVS